MSRLRPILVAFLFVSLAAVASPAYLAARDYTTARDTAVTLLQQGDSSLVVYRDEQTGIPNFVAGDLPAVKASVGNPVAAARAFFAENAHMFRMVDPSTELSLMRDDSDAVGMDHVRFQQRFNGVDVFGAQVIAHMRGNRVVAVGGSYFPDLAVNTQPTLTFEQAVAIARAEVGAPDAVVTQARSGLTIYAKDRLNTLTWKVELWSAAKTGRWLVFVNAHSGRIDHRINMLETALSRLTYNANNGSSLPGTLVCSDTPADPTCGDAALQAAHDNAGTVYNYYKTKFNRESINGAGLTIVSSAHYGSDYNNAFWNGSQMVYGDGDGVVFSPLSESLDVVAHELTHGVTDYTANLVYEDESGALNESYSDVMGVFADDFGNGAAPINWQLGEDVWTPGVSGDALRDMSNPHKGNDFFDLNDYTCLYRTAQPGYCGQPATVGEYAHYPVSLDLPTDEGGVHTNSGITNKVAYLLVQGGTFGGITVPAIGVAKTEQIYYRTLTLYLTPYSKFIGARNASIQACTDLIGQFGITAANCASVRAAFAAVGIGTNINYTHQVLMPLVQRNVLSTSTPALTGLVTFNNTPIGGITLELRRCDTRFVSCSSARTVATATTNSSGIYSFPAGASIPSTDDFTWYRVVYTSPSNGPDGKMLLWISDDVLTYQQGTAFSFDTFDIADVALGQPNSTTPRSFPVTFTWTARPVGGDYYVWETYDASFNINAQEYISLMHTTNSFNLSGTSDQQLAPGSTFSGTRYWDVLVVANSGYGITWNSNLVVFSGFASQDANMFAARRAMAVRFADQLRPYRQLNH